MVPISASTLRARSPLLRERLTLLIALHVCFRSGSNCSPCSKWYSSSQAVAHELVVGSIAAPDTRSSLLRERLTGTKASPRLGIGLCCGHHERNSDENGRSAHGHSPWG